MTRKEKLNRHIKYKHEGADWKYKCDKCDKSFKESKYFYIHVRVDHEKSPYNCDVEGCEAFYHTPDGLRAHKNRAHHAISKYKCESCNKLFVGDVHLNVHKSAVHEGKIYKCDLCDYTYISHDSYKKHKSRHNKIDTGPKYKCDQCGKHFKQKGNFDLHVKVHHEKSTFDCDEEGCNAFYISYQGLNGLKIRVHNADAKYKCEKCNKIFLGKVHLKVHKSAIHDRKILQCNFCEYTYTSHQAFIQHNIRHKNIGNKNPSSIVNRKRHKLMKIKLSIKEEDLENDNKENIESVQQNLIRDQKEELLKESENDYDFSYACPYCNEEFATQGEMGPHIASHI